MRNFLSGVVVTVLIIIIGGYLYAKQGYVDFSADQKPSSAETHFAMAAVDAVYGSSRRKSEKSASTYR